MDQVMDIVKLQFIFQKESWGIWKTKPTYALLKQETKT